MLSTSRRSLRSSWKLGEALAISHSEMLAELFHIEMLAELMPEAELFHDLSFTGA